MRSSNKPLVLLIACLLLFSMAAQLALSVRQQSSTWDECDHLFAGYMSLKAGDFALNPEHPPLAKMVAAFPLLSLNLAVQPYQGRYFKWEAYFNGRELVFRNDPAHGGAYAGDTLLYRARLAVMVFALLLAVLVFLASWEMFGPVAALIALTLVAFEPSLLTNGGIITTDSAVTCMLFAAVYAFYRYTKAPSLSRLLLTGLATGLAFAAKHSAILLPPMLILLAAGDLCSRWQTARTSQHRVADLRRILFRSAASLACILAIGVFVLWAFYGFRYRMVPGGPMMIPSLQSTMVSLPPLDNKIILFAVHHHLLPESYLFGLVDVRRVAGNQPTYLFGHILASGVWYYFPIVLLIKLTLPVLLFLAAAVWAILSGRIHRRELWFVLVPPVAFLSFALTSPLNVGIRHILPVVPFLLVLASAAAVALIRQSRRFAYPVAALLLWNIVSCLHAFPNYMPYSNELWGGPSHTRLYLSDAAVEWGQNLKWTKSYLDQHNIHDCYFAYFVEPFVLPSDYGIPCKLLPTLESRGMVDLEVPPVIHGTILISDSVLSGYELGSSVLNPYDSLFHRKPDDIIMNGVEVYHGDFELPLASSMMYEVRARKLLSGDPSTHLKPDPQAALIVASQAVSLAPEGLDAHLVLGNALLALNRKQEAAVQYREALAITERMEPSAKEHAEKSLKGLLAKCDSDSGV
ncbi:glycosyltransferase family 39 protein [Granulicella mallensis]|uniref:Glycosyltransferase RgtA/B/C/D-like domain-containing protein n=1 Tax=Granulicella mallensis TaxID=940614 RepID=A0A7W7ZM05_9BACT|nr:tetratricopeptide repeat protein [Granulicella mallensis]MBB5062385.1 hypothetical protein [Granulicella mallensis]